MKKLNTILYCTLFLLTCSSGKNTKENWVVDIDYKKAIPTNYSELFTPAEILPLEYSKESIISNPHNIAVSKNKLFVFEIDYSNNRKVVAFDLEDGKTVFVKNGSKDKGPGSFFAGSKMLLINNEDQSTSIGIVDRLQKKMVEFSTSDGRLLGTTMTPSINYYCEQFPGEQLLLGFSDNHPIEKYNIHFFHKGEKQNAYAFKTAESHLHNYHHAFIMPLYKLEDRIALKELYNDSLYFYHPNGLEKGLYLNFSEGKTDRNIVIEKGNISFKEITEYLMRSSRNNVLMLTQIRDEIIMVVDNYEEPIQCLIRFSLTDEKSSSDIFRLNLPISKNKVPALFLRLRGLYAEGRRIYGIISALEAQNLAKECENYQIDDPFFNNLIEYGNEVSDEANFTLITFELK